MTEPRRRRTKAQMAADREADEALSAERAAKWRERAKIIEQKRLAKRERNRKAARAEYDRHMASINRKLEEQRETLKRQRIERNILDERVKTDNPLKPRVRYIDGKLV